MTHTAPQPADQPVFKNAAYTKEYIDIAESFDGDIPGRRAARAYMDSSTAIVHHRVVSTSFVPKLYDAASRQVMREVVETTHRILCKVMQRYLDDAEYRKIFDYDPRLAELILVPRGYDALLPFARFDIFLDENTGDVAFCEFNGDGSSGMNENREITHSVEETATFKEFARRHHVEDCELFDAWVREFAAIYATYEHRVDNPRFAICDYLQNGVVDEFHLFAKRFTDAGHPCTVCDVRDLTFDGEVLRDKEGQPVHAIWRRCVTNDVLEFWDESQALIEAVKAQKVALIGSFAGHIVHDKQIFEALFNPATQAFLTTEEIAFVERTVPQTRYLDEKEVDLDAIRADKDAWIIKPADHYGADEVHAGCACTQEEWEGYLDRFADARSGTRFIAQRYVTPYKTETLPPDTGISELADYQVRRKPTLYNNINGLYLFNGRFAGVFSRLGPLPTISKDMQGMTAATIWVDCDLDGDASEEA